MQRRALVEDVRGVLPPLIPAALGLFALGGEIIGTGLGGQGPGDGLVVAT